ncbi:MAG: formylglycine-generating enzyme family protein [Candidatus Methylomirabilales bacterium]
MGINDKVAFVLAGMLSLGPNLSAGPTEGISPCGGTMAFVPAGPFIMGSDGKERTFASAMSSEAIRRSRWFEIEERKVLSLEAFCIDIFLVTNRDYHRFAQATGHRVPFISREDYMKQGFLVHDYDREVTKFLWREGMYPKGMADHPVVLASVEDAEAYCRWRGMKEGRSLRLPTEEEWEKAARGTDGRYFPWGNDWDPTKLNSARKGPYFTTPVGTYPQGKSPYGLYDMAGNVFEWTNSKFPDGRQVLKGCSWDDEGSLCRAAFRHGRPPSSRHILIGFRCAGSAS